MLSSQVNYNSIGIMNIFLRSMLLALSLGATMSVFADDMEEFKKVFTERFPKFTLTHVEKTPIDDVFLAVVSGQVIYMTKDGRYMFDGNLVDLKSRKNYTDEAMAGIRLQELNTLGEDNMIVYTPKKVKHTITVITDVDCPYCRKLHDEMDGYMASGIKVRYVFMPLKGHADYTKTVSIWCSDDQNEALDMAKAGAEIEPKKCDNPIDEHLAVARNLGVNGTPAIILQNGQLLAGYVPVAKLAAELDRLQLSAATEMH